MTIIKQEMLAINKRKATFRGFYYDANYSTSSWIVAIFTTFLL